MGRKGRKPAACRGQRGGNDPDLRIGPYRGRSSSEMRGQFLEEHLDIAIGHRLRIHPGNVSMVGRGRGLEVDLVENEVGDAGGGRRQQQGASKLAHGGKGIRSTDGRADGKTDHAAPNADARIEFGRRIAAGAARSDDGMRHPLARPGREREGFHSEVGVGGRGRGSGSRIRGGEGGSASTAVENGKDSSTFAARRRGGEPAPTSFVHPYPD